MSKVLKVAITGGPCGGKTTSLQLIANTFREKGYKVYTISETATDLINSGVKPYGDDKIAITDFQDYIFMNQVNKENLYDEIAEKDDKDVIIICDRGILDNRAYLTDEQFEQILEKHNMTEAEIIPKYDLVVHLVTCANGKPEEYSNGNNKARTETLIEAIKKDKDTQDSWASHPNFRIIGNETGFNEKMERVLNLIRGALGQNEIVRKEKYTVKEIDFSKLYNVHMIKQEIEEFVTRYSDTEDEMYRKTTINGDSYYTCPYIKKIPETGEYVKIYRKITEEEYYEALKCLPIEPIRNTRYSFVYDNESYKLDVYSNPDELVTIEQEIIKGGHEKIPPFISVGKKITDDDNYKYSNMFEKLIEKEKNEDKSKGKSLLKEFFPFKSSKKNIERDDD